MNKLFSKRRKAWHAQSVKYLRYVFNDHFVLFLMIMLGALVVQYINFLRDNHVNLIGKVILVVFVSLLSLLFGRLATFIEAADKVFLLVKELEVRKYLRGCLRRSMIAPAVIAAVLVLISAPLLQIGVVWLVIWFLVLLVLKGIILGVKLRQMQLGGVLNWSALINYEEKRKTSILRFFGLFTNVKGLKSHSRRRKYLDFLLPKTRRTYEYLFARSFLRSGDYLGLTVRLLVLSVLMMIFVTNGIVAVILVAVFNYLLIFQLLSVREAFDYQLLTRIYPIRKETKNVGLRAVLLRVMIFVTIVELVAGLICLRPIWLVLVILVVNFVLMKFYVRLRLKK